MKHWINRNYKTLIITAFLIPIITVAIVSISHVTQWYGISNPITWAVYLSVGIEIAAMSALAAISANMGRNVYFPFIIVTFIQFIGNIFFAYEYIDMTSHMFKSWVELVTPLVSFIGVEATDLIGHKRFLALFAGGLLPVISLSFLHMLVKFTEEDRLKDIKDEETKSHTTENTKIDIPIIVDEDIRLKLSDDELNKIEVLLSHAKSTAQATDQVSDDIDEELNLIVPEETEPIQLPKLEQLLDEGGIKSPGIFVQEKDEGVKFNSSEIAQIMDIENLRNEIMEILKVPKEYIDFIPTPEPIEEIIPEPIVEVTPEPIVEVTPEPIEEITPEPIEEIIPEPIEEEEGPPVGDFYPQYEETPDNPPIVENVPLIRHERDYFFLNDGLNTPANIDILPEPTEEDKKKI